MQPDRASTRLRGLRGIGSETKTLNRTQNLPPRFTPVTRGSLESSLILGGSRMNSSSAYPTSVVSSDAPKLDPPAVDARIEARHQDTADGFPLGLIPQLIDVLHILTEGQCLLSGKIRAARLDEASHSVAIVGRLDCLQIAVEQPVVVGSSTPPESPHALRAEQSELEEETPWAATFDVDCPTDPGVEVGGAVVPSASVPISVPSSESPAAVNVKMTGVHSSGLDVESVSLESALPSRTAASPLRRDYNFFDELDARLASLQEPTGAN
jgi:hypothetical protein